MHHVSTSSVKPFDESLLINNNSYKIQDTISLYRKHTRLYTANATKFTANLIPKNKSVIHTPLHVCEISYKQLLLFNAVMYCGKWKPKENNITESTK